MNHHLPHSTAVKTTEIISYKVLSALFDNEEAENTY